MPRTTVRELKIWLEQFDDDVEVEVLEREGNYGYGGDTIITNNLNLRSYGNWAYTDFRGNKYVKSTDAYFNKQILMLGEE